MKGVEWINIPAGEFVMGDHHNEGDPDEKPLHTVHLDSYSISMYEVTFEQYDAFCDDTGRPKPSDDGWGRGNMPAINVSWTDATEYCEWLSGKTGRNMKLPTEAQWEKAAAGTDQRMYPWGNNEPNASLCNYNNNVGRTQPVGSYPAGISPYGVHDMAGNVWEWCSDWYSDTYYSVSPTNNPEGPSTGINRVTRGGSWSRREHNIRTSNRNENSVSFIKNNLGFRLVLIE